MILKFHLSLDRMTKIKKIKLLHGLVRMCNKGEYSPITHMSANYLYSHLGNQFSGFPESGNSSIQDKAISLLGIYPKDAQSTPGILAQLCS